MDRNNWQAAIRDVHAKIVAGSSFAQTAGIIFGPRTTSGKPRKPDFLVMDPQGPPDEPSPLRPLRDLLFHYAPFFEDQGYDRFATRLRELAEAPDEQFNQYTTKGDDTLAREVGSRTSFSISGQEYLGTAWSGVMWPAFLLNGKPSRGLFIDGLHTKVVDAIIAGRLVDVLDMEATNETTREGRFVHIALDDGRALVWAPTIGELLDHP